MDDDRQLAADRALAARYLRPKQETPPPYEVMTRSAQAEINRIVALIDHVRQTTLASMTRPHAVLDMQHCPTCGQPSLDCGDPWPPSLSDVRPVRCRLPRGHRSPEHWHPPIWHGVPDLIWFTEEEQEQQQ